MIKYRIDPNCNKNMVSIFFFENYQLDFITKVNVGNKNFKVYTFSGIVKSYSYAMVEKSRKSLGISCAYEEYND